MRNRQEVMTLEEDREKSCINLLYSVIRSWGEASLYRRIYLQTKS